MKNYCLNIDNGPEWELAKSEFERIGIEVQRFQATVEDNRPLAFNKSVKAALSDMPDGGWLFEDDCTFDGSLADVKTVLQILPSDFNTFHLGGNIIGFGDFQVPKPTFYGPGLVKLSMCYQTHAIYYSKQAVEFILKNLNTEVLDNDNTIFDDWLSRKLMPQGKSFMINPMIAYQRPRHSEIWNCPADYTGCHLQGNNYLKGL